MISIDTEFVQLPGRSCFAKMRMSGHKGNQLSLSFLDNLCYVLQDLNNKELSCLIISGGNHVFSVGLDTKQLFAPETSKDILESLAAVNRLIENFEGITVSSVAGYALGGGAELALSCDVIVGDVSTKMGFPEISHGIFPGGGATSKLPRRLGISKSLELILTGKILSGSEAWEANLLDFYIDTMRLSEWSQNFAEKISRASLDQIRSVKRLVTGSQEHQIENLSLDRNILQSLIQNKFSIK